MNPQKIITNSAVPLSAMDHFSIIQLFVLVSSHTFNVLVQSQSSLQPCCDASSCFEQEEALMNQL